MGFGGAQGMITSLKNNSRRNKREVFSHISGEPNNKNQGIKIEPVSEEVLEEIRTKIKKQNRRSTIQILVIIATSSIVILWLLF